MTDPPRRVTPAEVSDFLRVARMLPSNAPLREQIVFFERKAELLSCIAADLDYPEAYAVAADAWNQVAALIDQLREQVQGDSEAP